MFSYPLIICGVMFFFFPLTFTFMRKFSVDNSEVIVAGSSRTSSSSRLASSEKSFNASQDPFWLFDQPGRTDSNSETTTTSLNDNGLLKMSTRFSFSGLRGGGSPVSNNGSKAKLGLVGSPIRRKDDKYEFLEDSEDPFAFDEGAFEVSKWDKMYGKEKKPRKKKSKAVNRNLEELDPYQIIVRQEETTNGENCRQLSSIGGNCQKSYDGGHHCSRESTSSCEADEEKSTLLADCLLTAVKVFPIYIICL